jgi:hypothetical protein
MKAKHLHKGRRLEAVMTSLEEFIETGTEEGPIPHEVEQAGKAEAEAENTGEAKGAERQFRDGQRGISR